MKSLHWFDYAIILCAFLSFLIGSLALSALYTADQIESAYGVMDGK